MKIKIPYDLRMKFSSLEGLEGKMDQVEVTAMGGATSYVPAGISYKLELNLSSRPDLLLVCLEWMKIVETQFQDNYTPFKIDVGPYEGLWPTHTSDYNIVHFRMDVVNVNKKDWKDWFVLGDIEYAPK